MTDFQAKFSESLKANGLDVSLSQYGQAFEGFCDFLLSENEKYNLTAIKTVEDTIVKHFVDSLLIADLLPQSAKVVDIGCGAGFPSLPLAIVRPDVTIVPVDSTAKKVNFVQMTADKLGLTNVHPIVGRVEDVATRKAIGSVDAVVSRAVAALPILCELALPLLKVGGRLVAMKSRLADEEIASAQSGIKILGGKLITVKKMTLVDFKGATEERNQVIIEKIAKTPSMYPRAYNQILKKPL